MSVKVITELSPVSTKRTTLTVDPQPISEIITGLNTGFPISHARVCRNGEIITDFSTPAQDGDTLWIKFVPYGDNREAGIGMKIGGWAMMIVGAVLTLTGYGSGFGVALLGAGLGMTLTGTVMMNISIPIPKDAKKPDTDPSIRGAKNQARPHGRIPVLFGRHRIYPDLAANPYTEIINGKQYYTQLFCGGYRDYVIDRKSFKLGETDLVKLSQTKDIGQILSGTDPVIRMEILRNGEASELYPYCIHEDAVNAALKNQIDDGNGQTISGELMWTTPDKTDAINVDIFLYNGIGKYDKEGNLKSASVEVRAFYKKTGDSVYTSLGFFNEGSNTISGAELKMKRYQVTKKGLDPGQYDVKIERVTADSTNSKIIDQVYVGSIRATKSEPPVRDERRQGLTIIALRVMATDKLNGIVDSLNYIATSQLPVYTAGGSGALYWLNSAETRNPAAMLLYALRGPAAQQIVDPGDIDWPALEAFYTWCEEHEYSCNAYLSESVTIAELLRMFGSTARADILRIDSKISIVQDIERPSPVQLFTPKNTVNYSIAMFNVDIPDAIALRFIDEDAGYAQNELSVYNTPDGNRIEEPQSIQKADLWGITSYAQASRIGMYNYGCLHHRPFVHTIEVDIEYLLCNKGDWIQYAGDIALTGSVHGRIRELIWAEGLCIGFRSDEPVPMTSGRQYAVRLRKSNGSVLLKEVAFTPGKLIENTLTYFTGSDGDICDPPLGDMYLVDENSVSYEPGNEIYFIEPFQENEAPKAGDVFAFGIRGYEALDLIITDIQPGQNLSATLTCVEYSPEIFGVDYPGFILPQFENKITPVSGAVDSGVVSSERWKFFAVYHDDEEEPPLPIGDGQNNDWHYAQTVRSVWQSSKMAESVSSGEWGAPVRIKNERGDSDVTPVWLSLLPQSKILECDAGGNILEGLLPLTSQARLFKYNSVLTNVIFSLQDAPAGVSIDGNGLITVGAHAVLDDKNDITVQAEYEDSVYTAPLSITKDTRGYAPRYLGTIETLPGTAQVMIIKGPVQGQVRARQGDYVLAVASGYNWQAGRVYLWTGLAWEYRQPDNNADLYIRCFKDGLDVPGLAQDMGWFGAVFARLLVAQQAFIEELQAHILKITGIIYGGDRFDFAGNVVDNNKSGWWLGSDGILKACQGVFKDSYFDGQITAKMGRFGGLIVNSAGTAANKVFNFSSQTPLKDVDQPFWLYVRYDDIFEEGPYLVVSYTNFINCTYNNKKVISVLSKATWGGVSQMIFKYSDNTTVTVSNYLSFPMTLEVSVDGFELIIEGLPGSSSLAPANGVWKDSNGYLRIN